MYPDVKRKLIDALRSGLYNKTTGRLYRYVDGQDCHCTLGVMCDVAFLEQVPGVSFNPDDNALFFYGTREGSGLIPDVIEEWSGITFEEAGAIAQHNDQFEERPFSEMADWIEENIE